MSLLGGGGGEMAAKGLHWVAEFMTGKGVVLLRVMMGPSVHQSRHNESLPPDLGFRFFFSLMSLA